MRTPFGWEICPPALSRLHPALPTLDRQCTSCASAPTANSTFLRQEWVPPVSSAAASACGAEVTDASSHQNSLLFPSVCFTVLLGFPCDQSRAASNGPRSNFSRRPQGLASTFSCESLSRSAQRGCVAGQRKLVSSRKTGSYLWLKGRIT